MTGLYIFFSILIAIAIIGFAMMFKYQTKASDQRISKNKKLDKVLADLPDAVFSELTKEGLLDCLFIALSVPDYNTKCKQLIVLDNAILCNRIQNYINSRKKKK